jgi:hypothetical protein
MRSSTRRSLRPASESSLLSRALHPLSLNHLSPFFNNHF